MVNLVLANNVRSYSMSSIYRIVRIDCELLDIPAQDKVTFGLDINAEYYRLINLRISDLMDQDPTPNFDIYFNEWLTDDILNAFLIQQNVQLPYCRDDFNLYCVNKEPKDSDYKDFLFITILNKGNEPIQKLFFSVVVERLARGY